MSLFKRGAVWWSYLYRDGVRHQYSTGTGNRKAAEKIEDKFKRELNDRRFDLVEADPYIRFKELAARFLASGSVRPHHVYHLNFILPFFAEFPVVRISKPLAEEYRRARRARNPERPVKDATVNRDLSTLRHILYWAFDERLIPQNPLARLKMARERRTRRQVLSIAEERLLLGAATGHLHTMIVAALDTGMRRGEITGQRWEDVDFPQGVLYVTRSKTPEGEFREIPLTHRLRELLEARREAEGLVIRFHEKPVRIVKRTWGTALKNSGIRHIRFHDLRHTFNTRLMEARVFQDVRMALMGHSPGSPGFPGSSVHAAYTHIELPVKRDAIRQLEAWKIHQETLLQEKEKEQEKERKENDHGSKENGPAKSPTGDDHVIAQSMEEEDPCRDRPGASEQAPGGNRGGRGKAEREETPTGEV